MLKHKIILSYASKIAIQFIQIIASVVVARVAGPTILGTVAYGYAQIAMFLFITDLGTSTIHIKLISEGKDLAKCIGTFARIKLGLLTFFIVSLITIYFISHTYFGFNFKTNIHKKVVLISFLAIIIEQFYSIANITFAAKMEQAKQDIPAIIKSVILQSLRIIVVLLGFGAIALVSSVLVSSFIALLIFIYLFRKYPIGKFDKEIAKLYIYNSLPIIIILISQTLIYWTDKVMLEYLAGSKEVGYYVAGFKFGEFIILIGASVGLLFFPLFSKAISKKDYSTINSTIEKFERFSMIFIFPVALFVAIYSDVIVTLILGEEYKNSIPILSIITISMFFMVFFQSYGNLILGKGLFRLSAKISVVQVIVFICCVLYFVSPDLLNLKSTGIALSLLCSNIFLGMLYVFHLKRKDSNINILPSIKIITFNIIYSAISITIYYDLTELIFKLVFAGIYFIGFWGLMAFMKLAKKDDWLMLKNFFQPGKLMSYIKTELGNNKNENNEYP